MEFIFELFAQMIASSGEMSDMGLSDMSVMTDCDVKSLIETKLISIIDEVQK